MEDKEENEEEEEVIPKVKGKSKLTLDLPKAPQEESEDGVGQEENPLHPLIAEGMPLVAITQIICTSCPCLWQVWSCP